MIVGAGLSGLLAACHFPGMPVVEAMTRHAMGDGMHKALLRFRSDDVAKLTGIPFRKVRVQKDIWNTDTQRFERLNIRAVNAYALRGTGLLLSRSINSLETVDRWVAPPDFYQRLADRFCDRIIWGMSAHLQRFAYGKRPESVISTIPLHVAIAQLGIDVDFNFARKSVFVERYRIPGADVFQTIYFPYSPAVLRASITGDLLIIESGATPDADALLDVCRAFAIRDTLLHGAGKAEQKYGKIVDIDATARRAILNKITTAHGIYSLGRFATWRNILLDDVVDDLKAIERLMKMGDYERQMFVAK